MGYEWIISYENVIKIWGGGLFDAFTILFVYPTWGNVASNRNIEINTPTNVIFI